MPHSSPAFHIMPVGWDYPGWVGEFYPQDLPEDWRLSYFANEFSAVLVPHSTWVGGSVDQLQSWVDDVSDEFRFFLTVSDSVDLSVCLSRAEILGANLGGFVFSGRSDPFEALSQSHKFEVYRQVEASFSEPLPSFSQTAGMALALLFNHEDEGGLVAQRGFFERLQANLQSDARVLLCFSGNPPAIDSIQKVRQLAQLMGLA